jgi:hypothetical protein
MDKLKVMGLFLVFILLPVNVLVEASCYSYLKSISEASWNQNSMCLEISQYFPKNVTSLNLTATGDCNVLEFGNPPPRRYFNRTYCIISQSYDYIYTTVESTNTVYRISPYGLSVLIAKYQTVEDAKTYFDSLTSSLEQAETKPSYSEEIIDGYVFYGERAEPDGDHYYFVGVLRIWENYVISVSIETNFRGGIQDYKDFQNFTTKEQIWEFEKNIGIRFSTWVLSEIKAKGDIGERDVSQMSNTSLTNQTTFTKTSLTQNTSQTQISQKKESALDILRKINKIFIDTIEKFKSKGQEVADEKRKKEGMTIFREPPKEIKLENGEVLGEEVKPKIEEVQKKLHEIIKKEDLEKIVVETPYGMDVKILEQDEKISVKKAESPGLWFKMKYYINKYILDKIVDKISDKIPGISCYKDYVKADKDTNLFNKDEEIKKTQLDLHVDKKAAENYNKMSGIEDREKALSPAKNTIPSTPMTKPFEYVVEVLGTAVKKSVANDYKKEYEITERTAIRYKRMGLKYKEIITLTIRDVEEETGHSKMVQTLNAQSKGEYKNQEARIRAYIIQLHEEGKI